MSSPDDHDPNDPESTATILPFTGEKRNLAPFDVHSKDVNDDTITFLNDQFDINACHDPLERVLLARVLQLITRLDKSARAEPEGPGDTAWHRYEAQADRAFRSTLTLLVRMRSQVSRQERDAARARKRSTTDQAEAVLAEAALPAPVDQSPPVEPPCPPDWRDRLVIDPEVNAEWPVVRGTRLWADHVAAMIEDGWTLASMLREYPKLTPGDVAACRQADSIGLCGPWPDGVAPPPRCHANLPRPRPAPGTIPIPDTHGPPTIA